MPSTRRAVLRAAAGALATGLAGCSLLSGSASSTRGDHPVGDRVTAYRTARHVVDGERRLFDRTGDDYPSEEVFVATPEERSALTFDGAGPVASFTAETDLSQHSLALFQAGHDACTRLGVSAVTKRPDEVRVRLCRDLRPADEACSLDDRRSTILAVRLPVDGRSLSEGMSVVHSSECADRFGPVRGES